MEILNSAVPTQKFMILEKASSRKFLKIRFSIFFFSFFYMKLELIFSFDKKKKKNSIKPEIKVLNLIHFQKSLFYGYSIGISIYIYFLERDVQIPIVIN